MKILFHENFLNKRGTSVALFDYAYYNQKILGNESIIISNNNLPNDSEVVKKFKSHFDVIHYNNFIEINTIIEKKDVDIFYIIKSGENDGMLVPDIKNVVHSVFCGDITQKHGDIYATVSEWLSSISNFRIPHVPHMINLPNTIKNYRNNFKIPIDAIVFGRYGGIETFDIPFVKEAIRNILNVRNDLFFLFMNTNKFIDHQNVIYMEPTSDLYSKKTFINTCDFMIHARHQGESFGLSVLEFACSNKSIITYGKSNEKSHIQYLGKNCIIYDEYTDIFNILSNISKTDQFNTHYLNDLFSPNAVMTKFKKIFIDG